MYLTQSTIADDKSMRLRVASCAAQQGCTKDGIDPDYWAQEWRRVWAASPGWDAAWESAEAAANPNPGADPAVITDGQILAQVQTMMPFVHVGPPPSTPTPSAMLTPVHPPLNGDPAPLP